MTRLKCLLLGLAAFGMLSLSMEGQDRHAPVPSFKNYAGKKIVFVVGGVSGSTSVSDNLSAVNAELGLGLYIVPIPWTRHDQSAKDLVDHNAQLQAAHRLASATKALRKDAPKAQIFYLGHSAGARIVLAAAEMAGPGSVERIFLTHAAVSTGFDLRNALKASRYGIDSFYSTSDTVLEAAGRDYVLADGEKGPAAGQTGFRIPADKRDAELYRNLRQYAWTPECAGVGGHGAWTLARNLKRTVAPLIMNTPSH